MMLLKIVNRTYGKLSEIADTLRVLFKSLRVNGEKVDWRNVEDWREILDSSNEVTFDQEEAFLGLLQEQMLDLTWAAMSEVEKRLMLAIFGPGHWINNQMGLPTTWIRRLNRL